MATALHLDISDRDLARVASELGATPKQVQFAFSRAARRTAGTLRRMSERGLRDELQLRKLGYLRKRLKSIKLRPTPNGETVGLWYGLNDMPVSMFKGRPAKTATGAKFRNHEFKGGFVGRSKRGPTIFKRKGSARLPLEEAAMPIKDQMDVYIEDHIFDEVEGIFWKHFLQDLNARVKYSIGKLDYT